MGCQRTQEPADRHADHHDPGNSPACLPQLPEVEAEPPFKQDHGNGKLDHGVHQGPKISFGIYEASAEQFMRDERADRPDQYADDQHQGDGWPPGAPGDPLRADTGHADHGNFHHEGIKRHAPCMPGNGCRFNFLLLCCARDRQNIADLRWVWSLSGRAL